MAELLCDISAATRVATLIKGQVAALNTRKGQRIGNMDRAGILEQGLHYPVLSFFLKSQESGTLKLLPSCHSYQNTLTGTTKAASEHSKACVLESNRTRLHESFRAIFKESIG